MDNRAHPHAQSRAFCILAVDPGLSGALAFYFPSAPDRVLIDDMPVVDGALDLAALAERIAQLRPDVAVVEEAAPRPGNSSRAIATSQRNYGALLAVIGLANVPVRIVRPQTWKKAMRLNQDKNKSRRIAQSLFPAVSDRFRRAKDDGRAEAALIALYWAEKTGAAWEAAR